MPFTYPNGHPFSPYYYAAQYGDVFSDYGFTIWFLGSQNNNWFYGDNGSDTMWGFDGEDRLYGGGNSDVLYGGDGNDLVQGDDGSDYLFGGAGNDILIGNTFGIGGPGGPEATGNNAMWGDGGNDILRGGKQNDVMFGGTGNDNAFGGDGTDVIFGGSGNDDIWGGRNGAAPDIMTGGSGDDRFGFQALSSGAGGNAIDIITDFDVNGGDILEFEVNGIGAYSAEQNTIMREFGYGTLLYAFDSGRLENVVFLEGVEASTVTVSEVEFTIV